ncbi:MAG: hypothetical protein ABI760_21475 [Ferruginibacter sp.]
MRLILKLTGLITACLLTSCDGSTNKTADNSEADTIKVQAEKNEMKADTVNRPTLVKAQADGSLWLTAESGKPVGPSIKYMPEWRAFGWFTAADMVEWDADVSNQGEYEVYLEWAVSDEEAGKEFLLEAGDSQLAGVVGKSGSWETFKDKNIGKIKLDEGNQKIRFKSKTKFDKGALLDLRQIKLVEVK